MVTLIRNANNIVLQNCIDFDIFVNMALEIIISCLFHFIVLPFLIVLPFSYDLSSKFRYYFKFFVFYSLISILSVLILPCVAWKYFSNYRRTSLNNILYFISRVLNIRRKVVGFEHLKANEPYVIVANQQNSIDIIGILEIWPHLKDDCVIIADDGLLSNPLNIIWRNGRCAPKNLPSQQLKTLIRQNVNILIFSKKFQDLNSDIFRLLIKEHLPIVPVIISDYYFLDTEHKIFDPGYLSIEILRPISTMSRSADDVPFLMQEIESTMTSSFLDLSKKVTPPTLTELLECYKFSEL